MSYEEKFQGLGVRIFLGNGVKLSGKISGQGVDDFGNGYVLLRRDGEDQIVYIHAINTIMPNSTGNVALGGNVA